MMEIENLSKPQLAIAVALDGAFDQIYSMVEHYEAGGGRVSPDGIAAEAIAHFLHILQEHTDLLGGHTGLKYLFDSLDVDWIAENAAYTDWSEAVEKARES